VLSRLERDDPAQVGPFALVGRLGFGGMGQVFLGRDTEGRLAAVKVIHSNLTGDPAFRARFAREIDTARRVQAPWIARVIDADPHGRRPWLATEYVVGPSLEDAVAATGPLPEPTLHTLAARLAEALVALHAAGVVHRDIKPSNVLIADDGPRLIDFGIAHAVDATKITHTGQIVGTPAFMSPEQAVGDDAGPPSDMFSLASVLTFAATGSPPFGHTANPVAALIRITDAEPDLAAVPPALRTLLEPCFAKNPAARPTAQQLAARVGAAAPTYWLPPQTAMLVDQTRRFVAGIDTMVSPGTAPPTTVGPPPARRGRWWPWTIAAGALLTVGVVVVAALLPARPSAPSPPPEPAVVAAPRAPARQVATLKVGHLPKRIRTAPDGKRAYVATSDGVSVIDTAARTVPRTIAFPGSPEGVAVSPDSQRVYVTTLDGFLTVLDASSGSVITTVPIGKLPEDVVITPDGRAVYALNDTSVSVIDTTTNAVTATIPIPQSYLLSASPDSRSIWVSNRDAKTITVIDTATNAVVATLPDVNGSTLDGAVVTFSPDGSRAYATGGRGFDRAIAVFDVVGRRKVGEIRDVNGIVGGIAVAPDGRHVYLASGGQGEQSMVRVFDTATNFAVEDVRLDSPSSGVAVAPDGRTLYVASFDTDSVLAVDVSPYV
jgi:YVTN family beta-propeller protein